MPTDNEVAVSPCFTPSREECLKEKKKLRRLEALCG